jgi:hypothetical protein
MVDLCRPSTLSTNNSLSSANSNNNPNNGNLNFFPSLFVCINSITKQRYFFIKFQLPYSHLIDPDRQESVTAALAAAAVVASSTMERTRLEEEKLRVQAKDKKDQSNIYFYTF